MKSKADKLTKIELFPIKEGMGYISGSLHRGYIMPSEQPAVDSLNARKFKDEVIEKSTLDIGIMLSRCNLDRRHYPSITPLGTAFFDKRSKDVATDFSKLTSESHPLRAASSLNQLVTASLTRPEEDDDSIEARAEYTHR